MDLQERYCNDRSVCACSQRVICFFVLLFAFALGLIFGAVFSGIILCALAAVIAFAATMLAAIIGLWLFGRCRGCGRGDD